jgi:hypothetical protein
VKSWIRVDLLVGVFALLFALVQLLWVPALGQLMHFGLAWAGGMAALYRWQNAIKATEAKGLPEVTS